MNLSIARIATRISLTALALAAFLALAGAPASAQAASKGGDATTPREYCQQTGGVVEVRHPFYGTNGGNPLRLAGVAEFCEYTSSDDGSRIHLLLSTLYTPNPSLGALAYYAEEQYDGNCQGNPASCYCTQLGGSDQFGGTTGAGGGWGMKRTIDTTLEACIFPDMSSVDSWGLFYHSAGIIRGIDLGTVLKYADPYNHKK